MDKIIYFDRSYECERNERGYFDFLDYAFSKTDYFMLVYVNYNGRGYTRKQKFFRKKLERFKVKSRSNPSWPGTLKTFSANSTYKIIFYKNELPAKEILKQNSSLSDWSRPNGPEDLAFFKGNKCWFYSVGHESIAAIIHADEEDLDFLETHMLAKKKNAFTSKDNYFDAYDEIINEKI